MYVHPFPSIHITLSIPLTILQTFLTLPSLPNYVALCLCTPTEHCSRLHCAAAVGTYEK
jgi:hypothetical protein